MHPSISEHQIMDDINSDNHDQAPVNGKGTSGRKISSTNSADSSDDQNNSERKPSKAKSISEDGNKSRRLSAYEFQRMRYSTSEYQKTDDISSNNKDDQSGQINRKISLSKSMDSQQIRARKLSSSTANNKDSNGYSHSSSSSDETQNRTEITIALSNGENPDLHNEFDDVFVNEDITHTNGHNSNGYNNRLTQSYSAIELKKSMPSNSIHDTSQQQAINSTNNNDNDRKSSKIPNSSSAINVKTITENNSSPGLLNKSYF